MNMSTRRDSHAGNWYDREPRKLDEQLTEWLSKASDQRRHSRAIISPHAGYDYSGPCAAFAFKQIDPELVKRIFVLGPSHYMGLDGKCALSCADIYATPLYNLVVDQEVYQKLYSTNEFINLGIVDDEEEHSVELQLPYIAKTMERYRDAFKIVPVVVGSLTSEREAAYGDIFAPYLADPVNLFVISSDFCHWGRRYQYVYYDRRIGKIWESIEALDNEGMKIIERLSADEFTAYLNDKGNTICGRHPIGVLLRAINVLRRQLPGTQFDLKFVQYMQSERCCSMSDCSVSYAAASLMIR